MAAKRNQSLRAFAMSPWVFPDDSHGFGQSTMSVDCFFASEADQASVEELLQKQEAAKKAEEAPTDNPFFARNCVQQRAPAL